MSFYTAQEWNFLIQNSFKGGRRSWNELFVQGSINNLKSIKSNKFWGGQELCPILKENHKLHVKIKIREHL